MVSFLSFLYVAEFTCTWQFSMRGLYKNQVTSLMCADKACMCYIKIHCRTISVSSLCNVMPHWTIILCWYTASGSLKFPHLMWTLDLVSMYHPRPPESVSLLGSHRLHSHIYWKTLNLFKQTLLIVCCISMLKTWIVHHCALCFAVDDVVRNFLLHTLTKRLLNVAFWLDFIFLHITCKPDRAACGKDRL